MVTGNIHSLETFGTVDGPGVRFVVFFQGCPLRCEFCHNPDTWLAGLGTQMSSDELISRITPYKPFYHDGGVTLSGGEPLLQHRFALELITKLKSQGLHTAIDTAGVIPLEACSAAIDAADLILLDFKPEMPEILEREKQYLEYCQSQNKPVWIRHVIIPGLTLNYDHLAELAKYLTTFSCIKKVELLPFHKLGEYKWENLNYTLSATRPPTPDEMMQAKEIFISQGLDTQ